MKQGRTDRGVSLVEGVVTLFLFAVVLSSVGSLLTDASRLLRRADELSWANQGSDWLNRMELDLGSAYQAALSAGGTAPQLEVSVKDLSAPDFLPATPSGSWSVDATALRIQVIYSINSQHLEMSRVSSRETRRVVLGEADSLEVERLTNGNFRLTLQKGKETLRREVPALCLDSLAAPL